MENAANLLLGTVIIFALVTLSALILVRGKQKRKNNVQIDRLDMFQSAAEPAAEQTSKSSFLGKIFGIFRRKKATTETEAWSPGLTETLEALEAVSDIQTSGDDEEQDGEKSPELTRVSADEELTEAEAEAFKVMADPESSSEGTETGDGEAADSGEPSEGLFGGGDDSLLSAFKAETVVDEVREALLARVGAVEIQNLAEEISSLKSRVKVYVPDVPEEPET